MHKTIILEPANCTDKCVNLRTLFQDKIKQGEVEIIAADSDKGRKLIEALSITDMTEPKVIMTTEALPAPKPAPAAPPATTVV